MEKIPFLFLGNWQYISSQHTKLIFGLKTFTFLLNNLKIEKGSALSRWNVFDDLKTEYFFMRNFFYAQLPRKWEEMSSRLKILKWIDLSEQEK